MSLQSQLVNCLSINAHWTTYSMKDVVINKQVRFFYSKNVTLRVWVGVSCRLTKKERCGQHSRPMRRKELFSRIQPWSRFVLGLQTFFPSSFLPSTPSFWLNIPKRHLSKNSHWTSKLRHTFEVELWPGRPAGLSGQLARLCRADDPHKYDE